MSSKRPESVLVVLYNELHQVLVLQRNDDPNFWQSVTGSLENNEVPIQTALREVYEETQLILTPPYSLQNNTIVDCRQTNQYVIREEWRYRYPVGTTSNFEYVFCAQITANSHIILSEHYQYLWLEKTQAIKKVWSSSNKQAINQFVPEA